MNVSIGRRLTLAQVSGAESASASSSSGPPAFEVLFRRAHHRPHLGELSGIRRVRLAATLVAGVFRRAPAVTYGQILLRKLDPCSERCREAGSAARPRGQRARRLSAGGSLEVPDDGRRCGGVGGVGRVRAPLPGQRAAREGTGGPARFPAAAYLQPERHRRGQVVAGQEPARRLQARRPPGPAAVATPPRYSDRR
jgi:hypothetical protein